MSSSFTRRALAGLLLGVAGLGSAHAGAFNNITVGQAGLEGNCTVATIQAAINLAAANPGPDTIWVTRDTPDGYYLATSALTVSNQDLEIVGGFDNCFDDTPSGYTDISGNGNAADPVFRIRGGGVVALRNLVVTLGDADGDEAGGVDYAGSGALEVHDSRIEYNHGMGSNSQGGGLRFRSLGGPAELTIARTLVSNNSARFGGGIYIGSENASRPASAGIFNDVYIDANAAASGGGGMFVDRFSRLAIAGPRVSVYGNRGTGTSLLGGGLHAVGATVDISATPVTGRSVFDSNLARIGGAIYVAVPGAGATSSLNIYSTTPNVPVSLYGNAATDSGGALAAFGGSICVRNASMQTNIAPIGAAINLNGGVAPVSLYWNACSLPASAGVACDLGSARCNQVRDNGDDNSTSVVELANAVYAQLSGVHLVDNMSTSLVRVGSANPILQLTNGAISSNLLSGSMFSTSSPTIGANVALDHLTMTRNSFVINRPLLDLGDVPLQLRNSMVDQPQQVLGGSSVQTLSQVMVNTPAAVLPPGAFRGIPQFTSPDDVLLVQRTNSPGVDVVDCPPGFLDGNGRPRNVDIPGVSNGPGTCDLGAFETPVSMSDLAFADGFE